MPKRPHPDETPIDLLPEVLAHFQIQPDLESLHIISSLISTLATKRSTALQASTEVRSNLSRRADAAEYEMEYYANKAKKSDYNEKMLKLELESMELRKGLKRLEREVWRAEEELRRVGREMEMVEKEEARAGRVGEEEAGDVLRLKLIRELGVEMEEEDKERRGRMIVVRNRSKGDVHILHVNKQETASYDVANRLWGYIG